MLRSFLFIPACKPKQIMFANCLGADGIIFDLEDSVSIAEKDAARVLLRNVLSTLDYSNITKCVRVNSLNSPFWQDDLKEIVKIQPDLIMMPKIETKEDVLTFESYIRELEKENGQEVGKIGLFPLIETALGVENGYEIASSTKSVKAILFGGEDYSADLEVKRTKEGNEIDYARKRLVNAAKAAGVLVFDTPYTDAHDDVGIIADATYAKSLGFSGKSAISPRHVEAINKCFSPSQADVDYAYDVVEAIEEGKAKGLGVVALRGKMIDAPVEKRARKTLEIAQELHIERSPKDEQIG